MSKIVVKFGGTSVANTERIINAAKLIKQKIDEGHTIAVVVSAMAGVTNDLIKKSKEIDQEFNAEEYDALLASGEQVTSTLFAGALRKLAIKSRSFQSWQLPIVTEGSHKNSRIVYVETSKLNASLDKGEVPVIPGFQGVTKDFRLSTLGRGGSDASAVALAKCINADYCEIYTDVEGVYTTNPDINPKAKKIDKISYEEMLEMATLGAKVMQSNSVQQAMMNDVEIHVRSTFSNKEGTQITNDQKISYDKVITGVAYSKDDAKITLQGVEDRPGIAASIFQPLYENNISVDMIVQNISSDHKKTDVTFTIKREDLKKSVELIKNNKEIKCEKIDYDDKVSKVSIVGAGMITHPGVAYKMFNSLAKEKINIMVISTSEIKISVLINEEQTQKAVVAIHSAFDLD
jgi:aspartate kinase